VSGKSAIDWASAEIGDNYIFGAEDPIKGEFDCSGLVQYAYRQAGFALPRTADQQYHATQRISAKDAQPGDLVYFLDDSGHAYHTGIYMGNGKFLEAPTTGQQVKIANVNVKHVSFGRVKGYQAKYGQMEAAALANDPSQYISYGNVQDLANAVPDIKKLLKQATAAGWGPDLFADKLRNTGWWKTNSDSAKKMLTLEASDPAEYKQQMKNAQAHVKQIAGQMGVNLTSDQIRSQATADLYQSMDDATLQSNIGALYASGGAPGGQATVLGGQIKQLASEYGIPVTQSWIDSHIKDSLMKGTGSEAAQQDLVNMAKSAYPSLSAQLDGGQTVQQIAQPYIAMMSQTLEIPDGNLTLTDPTIQKALTGQVSLAPPPKGSGTKPAVQQIPGADGGSMTPVGGGRTAVPMPAHVAAPPTQSMTLYDFQNSLRNDPRWDKTDNARQTAYQLMHGLGQQFGMAS
jgi:hypothetical protein